MAKEPWILKILSGTHIGAEVVLSDSEAVLGKDDSCDLVLDDVSLSGKHISLSSDGTETKLTLLDTAKPIYIDGEKFSEENVKIEAFQVIRIGTLLLTTGPAHEEWPPIDSLLKDEKKQEENDDGSPAESDDDTVQTDTQKPTKSDNKHHVSWHLFAVGGLLFGILSIVLLYLLGTSQPDNLEKASQAKKIDLAMQIAVQYGAQIQISKPIMQGGLHRITGYIDSELNRSKFIAQLKTTGISAEVDVISSEKTIHAVTAIIDQFHSQNKDSHIRITAVTNSPGDFILKGYVRNKAKWNETAEMLKQDIKSYRNLKDEVQTQEDRIKVLKNTLASEQLQGRVKVSATKEGLVLSGKLNLEEKKRLEQIKNDFNQKFHFMPKALLDTEGNTGKVKLDIRSIGFGDHPHIIMRDGQRYTEGAQLNNGYTIERITTDFIVLKKGDESEYYYFNSSSKAE